MEKQKAEIDKTELPDDIHAVEEDAGKDEAQSAAMHPLIRRDLILIACLVLSGMAGGVAFGVLHPRLSPPVAAPSPESTTPAVGEDVFSMEGPDQIMPCILEPFLLASEDAFFRVQFTMELESEVVLSEVRDRKTEIRAEIYRLLKDSEPIDVISRDRSLKSRLLDAVNQSLRSGQALRVDFNILHDQEQAPLDPLLTPGAVGE